MRQGTRFCAWALERPVSCFIICWDVRLGRPCTKSPALARRTPSVCALDVAFCSVPTQAATFSRDGSLEWLPPLVEALSGVRDDWVCCIRSQPEARGVAEPGEHGAARASGHPRRGGGQLPLGGARRPDAHEHTPTQLLLNGSCIFSVPICWIYFHL